MKKLEFKSNRDLAINPEAVGLVWAEAPRSSDCTDSGICIIRICGPLEHKDNFWFDSYESILRRFKGAMHDDDVKAVILQIDSPGGEVNGLQETVRKMQEMKVHHGKAVVAFCNEEAYSAAYAIACAADDIYLPESGGCGSIGVLATLCDRTQATRDAGLRIEVIRSGSQKAEGHPDIEITDPVINRVQRRVDQLAKQFFKLVSDARPLVSRKDAEALQGATVFGAQAVAKGLATAVMSFDEVVEILENRLDLSLVSNKTEGSEGTLMDLTTLSKRVAAAIKAVMSAKSPAERKTAAMALTRAQSQLTEATVKKTYKKRTVEEESEEDDGEAEAELEDEEKAEDEEAPPSSKAPPPDDDDDDDDDEDDEDSKKMKKSKKASAADVVTSFFGQSSAAKAHQLLESMAKTASRAEAAEKKIAKLEADAASAKLEKVISEGVAAGQLKPAQMKWARTQSIESLSAYLESTPAIFAPREQAAVQTSGSMPVEESGKDGLTAAERKICEVTGVSAESYLKNKASGLKKFGSFNEGGN